MVFVDFCFLCFSFFRRSVVGEWVSGVGEEGVKGRGVRELRWTGMSSLSLHNSTREREGERIDIGKGTCFLLLRCLWLCNVCDVCY
jgi:hypothetical protein